MKLSIDYIKSIFKIRLFYRYLKFLSTIFSNKFRNFYLIIVLIGSIFLLLFGLYIYNILYSSVLIDKDMNIKVYSGVNTYSISELLESENIINSALLFRGLTYFYNTENQLHTGIYIFKKGQTYTLIDVYKKILEQKYDEPLTVLVVPEGWDNIKIANRLETMIEDFDKEKFLELSDAYEGYLFPDTYFIDDNMSEDELLALMYKNFEDKNHDKKYEYEDIILASILEGEAKHVEDMQIISGILENRMNLGMRLQVDVAPETYKIAGLPAKPINNPGENALFAAKSPKETEYLYYITGKDGNMYYAKTYKEHKKNIDLYLR